VNTPVPADFQTRVRRQLRQDTMDAAFHLMIEHGWAAVRMTAIAAAVGISRQTLYKEFSSKEQIGEALLLREAERFIDGVAHHVQPHHQVIPAIQAAIGFALDEAATNPLLRAILTTTREGSPDTLLPLITTDSQPLIGLAGQVLRQHITTRAPGLDPEDIAATADALVRLTVSHLMLPLEDTGTTVRRLTRLAERNLGLRPSDS
jgi:AcrR family transcriptional regulator